jgi:hypothetical protein
MDERGKDLLYALNGGFLFLVIILATQMALS